MQKVVERAPEWVSLSIKLDEKRENFVNKIESGADHLKDRVLAIMDTSLKKGFKNFLHKYKGSSITIKGVYSKVSLSDLEKLLNYFFAVSKLLQQPKRKAEFLDAFMKFEEARSRIQIDIIVENCN